MTTQTMSKQKEELYSSHDKTFLIDADTIARLNYALTLNRSSERYIKVETEKQNQ